MTTLYVVYCQGDITNIMQAKLQEDLHNATVPQESLRAKLAEAERMNQIQATQLEHAHKTLHEYKNKIEDINVDLERLVGSAASIR